MYLSQKITFLRILWWKPQNKTSMFGDEYDFWTPFWVLVEYITAMIYRISSKYGQDDMHQEIIQKTYWKSMWKVLCLWQDFYFENFFKFNPQNILKCICIWGGIDRSNGVSMLFHSPCVWSIDSLASQMLKVCIMGIC